MPMSSRPASQNGHSDCPKCGMDLSAVVRISDDEVTGVFCPSPNCSYSEKVDAPADEFPAAPGLGEVPFASVGGNLRGVVLSWRHLTRDRPEAIAPISTPTRNENP